MIRLRLPVVVLALSIGACRKETPTAQAPPPSAPARRAAVEREDVAQRTPAPPGRERVILVGLDGADWSLLDRLAASGAMPNVARLAREGRTARLASFVPMISPIVWTTIATGVSPEKHGILDFQEVDPASGEIRPVSGASRRVPALWNVASASGKSAGVVGWWATHPAEEVNGFFVSDRISSILFEGAREGMVFPAALEAGVERVREQEGAIADEDLKPFLAMSEAEISAERSKGGGLQNPVVALAKILAGTRATQRVARELYDRQTPDLLAVYFEGTDAIGHVFASYAPPRLPCVSEEDFRKYSGAVEAYYRVADALLGQWMRRAAEDGATLVVCSDHGFKWEEDRTCARSSLGAATAAFWHKPNGVLMLWGGRSEPSPARGDASVFDVAPTISALLGLPLDREMRGTVLASFLSGVRAPAKTDVYGKTPVRRRAMVPSSAEQRSEYAEKLKALGYLSGGEATKLDVKESGPWPGRTEAAWNNLGLLQREAGRLAEAEGSFRQALRLRPNYSSPMFNLAVLERTRGRWPAATDRLLEALHAGHAEPERTLLQWAADARRAGQRAASRAILEKGAERYPASEELAVALARERFEAKDCASAASALASFAETKSRDTLNLLGLSTLCAGRTEEARRHLERSLAIDPAQPVIREALRMIGR
ncbi:MAG TPA: alkaline phosphatase family protein [Thermoanaerobaculia bacterium]|nr:alkaline phosphatase family protein [Thermoanaerobaculia bacterium]